MIPNIDKLKLFHMTSYKNLRSIAFEQEALLCKRAIAERHIGHIDIAYNTVQSRRFETTIPLPPYGNLHDYVPFSFCPRPVMLLPIKNGRVAQYQDGQNEIIYLITDFSTIQALNSLWVFTDGHAIMKLTDFYNNPADFREIAWEVIESNNWADTPEDNDRKRKKQAEFLLHDTFPWSGVKWIVTINEDVKAQVECILHTASHKPLVKVNKSFYY